MESIVAEVRLTIPDAVISKLQRQIGESVKVTDLARDAITLLNWAVDERAKGRLVLSTDDAGQDAHRLAMTILDTAAANSETSRK